MEYKYLLVYIRGHNITISALDLVLYLVSLVCPELVLAYAGVEIFLDVVRADSQVSAQVTLKAIRSARNVLGICFVALALCSSGSL